MAPALESMPRHFQNASRRPALRFARRAGLRLLLIGLTMASVAGAPGCSSGSSRQEKADATPTDCDEYLAVYRRCFETLGPEAAAAGERLLAAASKRLTSDGGDDAQRSQCRSATRRLEEACR
jgi:hypothetical protein